MMHRCLVGQSLWAILILDVFLFSVIIPLRIFNTQETRKRAPPRILEFGHGMCAYVILRCAAQIKMRHLN